jgi:hypothetical protein
VRRNLRILVAERSNTAFDDRRFYLSLDTDMFIPGRVNCPVTMSDPSRFRESTQIVLPEETLDGVADEIARRFTVTIVNGDRCRIVGSPVEIKKANAFLARNGINVP